MVRRNKRRKGKYTWLPVWGTPASEGSGEGTQLQAQVDFVPGGDYAAILQGVFPVLRDSPHDDSAVQDRDTYSMADRIGSEYFLRRIVGKLHVGCNIITDDATEQRFPPHPVWVKTGFFVAQCDPNNHDQPIDYSVNSQIYQPTGYRAQREPWIFQRSWMLGWHGVFTPTLIDVVYDDPEYLDGSAFPPSNALYGSAYDGPHIDIKTARRVKEKERLWWTFSVQNPRPSSFSEGAATMSTKFLLDVRCLGGLRRARQGGNFT